MGTSKLNEMIETSLSKIKELAKTETVIGDPISVPGGITILPVSKISIGYATGGIDFPSKKGAPEPSTTSFGGAGGTGITVTPIAFLLIKDDGTTTYMPIMNPSDADAIDKITTLVEKTPDVVAKIKAIFDSKSKNPNTEG